MMTPENNSQINLLKFSPLAVIQQQMEIGSHDQSQGQTPGRHTGSGHETNRNSKTPLYVDSTLPPGWRRKVALRKGEKTQGRFDVYIFTPENKMFRSKQDVRRYFEEINKTELHWEDFDFSVYGTKGQENTSATETSGLNQEDEVIKVNNNSMSATPERTRPKQTFPPIDFKTVVVKTEKEQTDGAGPSGVDKAKSPSEPDKPETEKELTDEADPARADEAKSLSEPDEPEDEQEDVQDWMKKYRIPKFQDFCCLCGNGFASRDELIYHTSSVHKRYQGRRD